MRAGSVNRVHNTYGFLTHTPVACAKHDSTAGFIGRYFVSCQLVYVLSSVCGKAGRMSTSNFLRLYEQLRAVWKSKDKEQPFVRGYLLTSAGRTRSSQLQNGYNNHHQQNGGNASFWDRGAAAEAEVVERWFTLLGHALFYCTSRDSEEYSGALLTDIFSPVMARVDDKTMSAFGAPEIQQVRENYPACAS